MRIKKYTSEYFELFDEDIPLGFILIKDKEGEGEVHIRKKTYLEPLREDIKKDLEKFKSEHNLKFLMVYSMEQETVI